MTSIEPEGTKLRVLLIDDSPGDVRLTREAFLDADMQVEIFVATDGIEAMAFLQKSKIDPLAAHPDIILLDLNLPKMDGREVLAKIKADPDLSLIPTIILTTSTAETDIQKSYQLRANCYLTKPVQLEEFQSLVRSISDFWLMWAKLPKYGQTT